MDPIRLEMVALPCVRPAGNLVIEHVHQGAAVYRVAAHGTGRAVHDENANVATPTYCIAGGSVSPALDFDTFKVVIQRISQQAVARAVENSNPALFVRNNPITVDRVVLDNVIVGEVGNLNSNPHVIRDVIKRDSIAGSNPDCHAIAAAAGYGAGFNLVVRTLHGNSEHACPAHLHPPDEGLRSAEHDAIIEAFHSSALDPHAAQISVRIDTVDLAVAATVVATDCVTGKIEDHVVGSDFDTICGRARTVQVCREDVTSRLVQYLSAVINCHLRRCGGEGHHTDDTQQD